MEKIVFTNGCFDLIHPGHIDLLRKAKGLGTKLIVGINSDDSVRRIKGAPRPFLPQDARSEILSSLVFVDEVRIFEELTPERLIKEIKPDILVKGGDWKIEEIIGSDFVRAHGGEVYSIPLIEGYSTTNLVKQIRRDEKSAQHDRATSNNDKTSIIKNTLLDHIELAQDVLRGDTDNISVCADLIYQTFKSGNKILICGNGGSAADAQHLAAEFVGRYERERVALPAIALTTDTSALTALANDYDFQTIFARQIDALAAHGDLLIAISTSGNSPNVIAAVMAARAKGCRILGMTGANGKKLASLSDECLMIPHQRTARIQELHITIAHTWCEILDTKFINSRESI